MIMSCIYFLLNVYFSSLKNPFSLHGAGPHAYAVEIKAPLHNRSKSVSCKTMASQASRDNDTASILFGAKYGAGSGGRYGSNRRSPTTVGKLSRQAVAVSPPFIV